MQDERPADALDHLFVDREEKTLVGFGTHEVSGGMIGQDHDVGPGLELGFGKEDGDLLQGVQEAPHFVGPMADQRRKFSVPAMWQRWSRAHDFADDGYLSPYWKPEDAKGFQHDLQGRLFQDILGIFRSSTFEGVRRSASDGLPSPFAAQAAASC
jgi:hypothetical protein